MTLKHRLLSPIVIIGLISLVGAVWIAAAAFKGYRDVEALQSASRPLYQEIGRIEVYIETLSDLAETHFDAADGAPPEWAKTRLTETTAALLASINAAESVSTDPQKNALFARIDIAAAAWIVAFNRALTAPQPDRPEALKSFAAAGERLSALAAALAEAATQRSSALVDAENQRFQNAVSINLVLTLCAVLIATALMVRRIRRVARVLLNMNDAMRRLRLGQHDAPIDGLDRRDELGAMAHSVREFGVYLKALTAAKRRIDHMVGHDQLTDLLNRRGLSEQYAKMLAKTQATKVIAAIELDIVRFKNVNRVLGHKGGDRVIQKLAQALIGSAPQSFRVARTSVDEFVVIGPVSTAAEAVAIGRKIEGAIAAVSASEQVDLGLRPAIGVALDERGAACFETLMRRVEIARRQAKAPGGGQIHVFSDADETAIQEELTLSRELPRAFSEGEIVAFFQPQIDARTDQVFGFEALVRWRHPTLGVLGPGKFMDLIFQNGLGDRLTTATLHSAASALSQWREAGYDAPQISINLTASQLRAPDLIERLDQALLTHGGRRKDLVIEVLESVLFDDDDDITLRNLRSASALGYALELDDFGTGHSSIANLQRISVDGIKIDRSFVTGIDQSAESNRLATAMVGLCETLGIACIAEGVERPSEMAALRAMGCHRFQGFGLAKPMPAEDVVGWVRNRRRRSAA